MEFVRILGLPHPGQHDLYQHYSTSDRAACLSLDEAPAFRVLFDEIASLKDSTAADLPSAIIMVEKVFQLFERFMRDGTLDGKLLME